MPASASAPVRACSNHCNSNSPQSPHIFLANSDGNDSIHLTRHPDLVLVQQTKKGRGVFATNYIPARTVVEVSPVLLLDAAENAEHIQHTKLWFYTYNWATPSQCAALARSQRPEQPQAQQRTQALPLGLGSLFNHASARSRKHNTGFTRDFSRSTISYITLRDIEQGEELCICYGEDSRLGFKDADAQEGAGPDANVNGDSDESFVEKVDIDIFAEPS